MIRVSVLGATGYAGIELVRLLCAHPNVQIAHLVSHTYAEKKLHEVYPNFRDIINITLERLDIDAICADSDVAFTALPHGASKEVIPSLLERGIKVIDFSGDYRYDDEKVYEAWYNEPHSSPHLLKQAVYGLCELHREHIASATLVGNPGCYTTCSILALTPLLKHGLVDTKNIIIDAKSGTTGAGRAPALGTMFSECAENMKAYKIATHRHTSEIEQELSKVAGKNITLSFTPHLIPAKRGILATCYANLTKPQTEETLLAAFSECYQDEPFVRLLEAGTLPQTNQVTGSNYVDIGLAVDQRLQRVVVVACIDNLIKGAAGQAVQNMNLMFGLPETTALLAVPLYL